jgi:formamidopyrimidine-DNA glycosylase
VPELPEVETIVRQLAPRLAGRRVRRAALAKSDVLRGVSKVRLLKVLTGNRFASVERRAKHAVFGLASGERMVIQPGMTGAMIVYDRALSADQLRYAVLTCALDDRKIFVYRDVRRLGTILLLDPKGWARYTAAIGPEPLDPAFTPEVLGDRIAGLQAAIKKVIMDQKRLAGVGNIYANEALFTARIDPSKPAHKLNPAETRALHGAIVDILRRAIASSGTTVRDYRTGTGERGSFQLELNVYGRAGEPCRRCGRRLATTHAIDARQTTLCAWCQG